MVEKRKVASRHDPAAARNTGFAYARLVEPHDRLLCYFGFGQVGPSQLAPLLGWDRLTDVGQIGHPALKLSRQSDSQFGQPQRQRHSISDEVAEVLPAAPLDNLRDHPKAGRRMILELAP